MVASKGERTLFAETGFSLA